jgi:hypothetical protein
MCLWNLELLPVDWILRLEVDFVLEILGETQVVFVNAESVLMFAQDVQVPFLEFLRHLQMASSFDFFSG